MQENLDPTNNEEQELKKDLKFSFLRFFSVLINFFKTVVSIRQDVDYEGSVNSIKKDIDFKGVNVWVLGSSIVIASIGLNVNSTAVIIGAMLISPLMGPIVGAGLSIGTNDWTTLLRSLKSLGTAVLISLIISTIYFKLTPFGEVQSELESRTQPGLLDVLVVIFSGIALIVAKTQRGTIASVIMGVAIATALMPPLCTAGYGLANGNWHFFFGAFYLFLINSVFITLSTWLIVKYLKFPLVTHMDPKKQRRVKTYILIFSLLIVVPSGFTFWNAIQKSIFENNAEQFIKENFQFDGTWINKQNIYYSEDDVPQIDVYLMGDIISESDKHEIEKKLAKYELEKAQLTIHQFKDRTDENAKKLSAEVKTGILEEIYKKNEELLNNKDATIKFLEEELIKYRSDTIPFGAIKNEMAVQYKHVKAMAYGKTITTDFKNKQDTVPMFFVRWESTLTPEEVAEKKAAMQEWLKVRLNNKKVRVINY